MCESKEVRANLDREFAERLRNENSEQFETLVKMHLSFELDLTTIDEYETVYCEKGKITKWNRFHKKAKGCTNTKTTSPSDFKQSLTKHAITQLRQLIDYLVEDQNIRQEGIFRRTGALSRQNELKNQLNQGMPLKLNEGGYTVHDCASVFKGFLSELPEPLMTDLYYPAHSQLAEICNSEVSSPTDKKESRILQSLQLLILLLPDENRILLIYIIEMLHKTIQYEKYNKMSSDSLATLFTPHLICKRKLTPEALHSTSQTMSSVVSFMITKGTNLFDIPSKLATDIRAYFVELKRKKTMSPEQILDESVTSDSTANTIFTFIDREKTAAAHHTNPTDTALAQLYAHIQSLPESSKKRKLIKQFNKENGQGTPLQLLMLNRMKSTSSSAMKSGKSLGDSIKKHIFHKSLIMKTPKKSSLTTNTISSSTTSSTGFNTPIRSRGLPFSQPKMRVLFQSPISSSFITTNSNDNTPETKKLTSTNLIKPLTTPSRICSDNLKNIDVSVEKNNEKKTVMFSNELILDDDGDEDDDNSGDINLSDNNNDDDVDYDDDANDIETNELLLNKKEYKSKYKSEPNLNQIINRTNRLIKGVSLGNLRLEYDNNNKLLLEKTISFNKNLNLLNKTFKENNQNIINYNRNDDDNILQSYLIGRNSMSPITKSTKRMPKSMQESIMTPRSRKPVMLLGVNLESSEINQQNYYNSFSSLNEEDEDLIESEKKLLYRTRSEGDFSAEDRECALIDAGGCNDKDDITRSSSAPDSLTSVFRDYLFSRSVLTATPADLSFSSQPDDFGSTTDIRDLSETEMSESLLYCLDGNKPEDLSFISNESDNIDSTDDNILINYGNNSSRKRHHVSDVTYDNHQDKQLTGVCNLQIKKVVLHSELGETSL